MTNLRDVRPKKVTITLGGEERELRYDMNAFAEMENIYSSVDAALSSLDAGRISDVRNILWLGLIHAHVTFKENDLDTPIYTLSRHTVGSWIEDIGMLRTTAAKLAEAISSGMPELSEEELAKVQQEAEIKN